ncbi:MAG TPA: c-type cytochrome, partial [Chthoniobacteraceae bacterium]|nr:c-type cytochrome [Chthoniobacteraceae bacterium]
LVDSPAASDQLRRRMPVPRCVFVLLACCLAYGKALAAPPPDAEQRSRGEKIYTEKCLLCHQLTGQGAAPLYPPLAKSDWLMKDRARAIRVLCEGLAGTIVVNGETYSNAMPAQVLDDSQVADVLTFVTNAWGNTAPAFSAEEVAAARANSRFKTYDELVKASAFQPLPSAPAGWTLREVVQLPEFFTRMASDGRGTAIYLLAQNGGVYQLDLETRGVTKLFRPEDYLDRNRGELVTLGMTVDPQGRLLIVSNQKLTKDVPVYTNEVILWRSSAVENGRPARLLPWFTHRYPHGVGGFNHGVSHLAFGPDGMLYVSSGSRTDGGEVSRLPRYEPVHEVDTTACVWKLDPKAETPTIEVVARGIRNAYSFAWDEQGHLFTFSNGPDYDAGEEMDFIEPGSHHGFPFQYENWPVQERFPYPHTPPAPEGVAFRPPVENIGPDAGGTREKPAHTFNPHSSPAGTIWCGDDFAPPLRGTFLLSRFGNLLSKPEDSGFDVLTVRPRRRADGAWEAEVHTLLASLGRPIDVHALPGGRALIMEYTRATNFKDRLGWLPGRILELSPMPASR